MRELRDVFLQAAGEDWMRKLIGTFKVLKEYFTCVIEYFFYIFTDDRTRKENIDLISISLFNNYSTFS